MAMSVRSQNPFNQCNPWSKKLAVYCLWFISVQSVFVSCKQSVKSFHNQCNGNVVRSQNPFNQCNPWSKKTSTVVLFFGGTSVKSLHNQCNGNVRAQP